MARLSRRGRTVGFWRPAVFGRRVVWTVIRPVSVRLVIVLVIIGLIIDIITIGVRTAGVRMATIRTITINAIIIRSVPIGTVTIGTIHIGAVAVAVSIQPIMIRTVKRPVIIGSFWVIIRFQVVERRRAVMIVTTVWSFLQNGADRFVLGERDGDPAMVVVNARPLARVQSSGVHVHQRLFVGDHLVQLL